MPKVGEKNKILSFVIESAEDQILNLSGKDIMTKKELHELFVCLLDKEDVADVIFDYAFEGVSLIMLCRRGIEYPSMKSTSWRDEILSSIDDVRFKQMLRVHRQQFSQLGSFVSQRSRF